jgi:hypothetical protein
MHFSALLCVIGAPSALDWRGIRARLAGHPRSTWRGPSALDWRRLPGYFFRVWELSPNYFLDRLDELPHLSVVNQTRGGCHSKGSQCSSLKNIVPTPHLIS